MVLKCMNYINNIVLIKLNSLNPVEKYSLKGNTHIFKRRLQ